MPARLSISSEERDTLEVDLWGVVFTKVPITRTRQRKIFEVRKQVEDLDEEDVDGEDKAVQALAEILDQMLAPTEGARKKPSTIVLAKWKADELESGRLLSFIDEIAAADRPT